MNRERELAEEIANEFCGGSEAVKDVIGAKLLAAAAPVEPGLTPEVQVLLRRIDEDAKGTRCLTMAEVTLCLNELKRLAQPAPPREPEIKRWFCQFCSKEHSIAMPDYSQPANSDDPGTNRTMVLVPKDMKCHKCGAEEPWKDPLREEVAKALEQLSSPAPARDNLDAPVGEPRKPENRLWWCCNADFGEHEPKCPNFQPPAPVSQARDVVLKLVCEHTQWNESTPSAYVLAWATKIEAALTAAEQRAREKALEDAARDFDRLRMPVMAGTIRAYAAGLYSETLANPSGAAQGGDK